MELKEVFGAAQWVCAGAYAKKTATIEDANGVPHFPILRNSFVLKGTIRRAVIRVLGLGFYHCYLNGQEISEDQFLPLSTDFEARDNYPTDETVTGHRIYVPEYDVTTLLKDGKNTLALYFGGGWYTFDDARFGAPKAIYRLTVETEDGVKEFISSTDDKIGAGYVRTYHMTRFEAQDYQGFDDAALTNDFDDSAWKNALPTAPLSTDYQFCDCPADRVEKVLTPVLVKEDGNARSYDCGQNFSGYPVLKIKAKAGETVTVQFAEEKHEDGTPDMNFNYGQQFTVVSDGKERIVHPMFTWFAFRYFTVTGDAEVVEADFIHTAAALTSEFDCDNETLNWMFRAYINTQHCNMHAGIPSDCPHIERRGYTGDGQLTCHAVMDTMDARAFYHKWIADIGDCQDLATGHVQYTAPYTRCGGGPGGWGCAIVEVPYTYYKHYGDKEPMQRLYPQMKRYFDYLDEHSVDNLVASDKPGEWCLGDWCAPIQVILPAAFVNNYFYIKSLNRAKEIAALIGMEADIPAFDAKIKERKDAIIAAYFNTWDGNFIGCMQGANAFAIDIGLGDDRTYRNLVNYYKDLGRYDTGIFGTDLVTKVLFEHGDGDLAAALMMSEDPISFDGMRKAGSTTIWENWPHATWDRSRNHPMFGAVAAYLFDFLLGIGQTKEGAGYEDLIISPVLVDKLTRASGKRTLPAGEVSVSYTKAEGTADFTVVIPAGVKAVFRYADVEKALTAGENRISVKL